MDELKVLIFGQLEDATGTSCATIDKVADTSSLIASLCHRYPGLKEKKFMIALDQKIVKENTSIAEGAHIALLPPFSGG
jgi:molybdopterin synthase sulfur carrier subunit